ncbi:aminotransferase class V-fold PLP-dependent enzyme [Acidisoma sp. S159]|uniref:aminotransferase class V-fold PLP-dependent enzyme n=1 Tax=Acidisoma sp. S159 TaxID=1747225 RepID=UPI00131D6602|nr:aminotransferase class V-fold PLP-dependent enzyme [Acidisoma sp. S159]
MTASSIDSLFPDLGDSIYMNTASIGVACRASRKALVDAAGAWAEGRFDFVAAERAGEEARCLFAELISARVDCVSLIPSASAVAGQVAAHLSDSPRRGNIVIGAQEYTSALFPFLQLRSKGFEIRLLPFQNGAVKADQFAVAADEHTRLIAVSAVQSASGYRVDIAALREVASHSGALLYVDGAQMCGALALDVQELQIDALAAPAHKFLLGARGMGFGYFAPYLRDVMTPVGPGWKAAADPMNAFYGPSMDLSVTASRFDQSLAWMIAPATLEGLLALRGIGFRSVAANNLELARQMRNGLRSASVEALDHGAQRDSTIFSIATSDLTLEDRLRRKGVVAATRNGRLRVALHLYNTASQIDLVLSLL